MINSFEPSGKFRNDIAIWKKLYRTKETRTVKNFQDSIIMAYANEGAAHTAGTRSAAAVTTSTADITALISAHVAAAVAASDKRTSPKQSSGKNDNWIHYCWYHGTNYNHPSNLCKHATTDPRHKKSATAADKKGGKETPFQPFHKTRK